MEQDQDFDCTAETEFGWQQDQPGSPNWHRIQKGLQAPFDPTEIEWRIDGRSYSEGGQQVARVLPYVKRDALFDRLDDVIGPQNYTVDVQPLVEAGSQIVQAKAIITIHGISRADFGSARIGNPEKAGGFDKMAAQQTKTAATDSDKRAGSAWGIARYLARVGRVVACVHGTDLTEAAEADLQRWLSAWDRRRGTFPGEGKIAGLQTAQQGSQAGSQQNRAAASHSQAPQAARAAQQVQSPHPAPQGGHSPATAPQARAAAPTAQAHTQAPTAARRLPPATDQQLAALRSLAEKIGDARQLPADLSQEAAGRLIGQWGADLQRAKGARQPAAAR